MARRGVVEAIRRFNIERYLAEFKPRVEAGGKELVIRCPFCRDASQHLYVNLATKLFHCFICNYSRNLVGFIMDYERVTFGRAMETIRGGKGADESHRRTSARAVGVTSGSPQPLPPTFSRITTFEADRIPHKLTELLVLKRVSVAEAEALGWGWCRAGEYRSRLVMPVVCGGIVVGFQARDYTGTAKVKYQHPPGFKVHNYLWGWDEVVSRRSGDGEEEVVLVEGVFDALGVGVGVGMALFSRILSGRQLTLVAELGVPVVLCLDGDVWDDVKAVEQMQRTAAKLAVVAPTKVARLPLHEDPCSLGVEVWKYIHDAQAADTSPVGKIKIMDWWRAGNEP